jgi:hypothetical protein
VDRADVVVDAEPLRLPVGLRSRSTWQRTYAGCLISEANKP